jgi:hypothetical protein
MRADDDHIALLIARDIQNFLANMPFDDTRLDLDIPELWAQRKTSHIFIGFFARNVDHRERYLGRLTIARQTERRKRHHPQRKDTASRPARKAGGHVHSALSTVRPVERYENSLQHVIPFQKRCA